MSKKDLTDQQIEATFMDKLARKGMWGAAYRPTESMVSWMTHKITRNGKRVWKILDSLGQRELLLFKKSQKVVSLNPKKKEEILKVIDELY